jgi:hypothetical protein
VDEDIEGAVRLEPSDWYDEVLIGKVEVDGEMVLVYDHQKMAEKMAQDFADGSELHTQHWSDALEFIEYNTIRALAYMGGRRPLLLYRDVDLEEDEPETP